MIRMVDMKCSKCGKVHEEYLYEDNKEYTCNVCKGKLLRIYGNYQKYKEYPEGYYENFDHEPVYIKDREDFYKKCKAYGLEPKIPKAAIERRKAKKIFI